jgi:hypothetical protein
MRAIDTRLVSKVAALGAYLNIQGIAPLTSPAGLSVQFCTNRVVTPPSPMTACQRLKPTRKARYRSAPPRRIARYPRRLSIGTQSGPLIGVQKGPPLPALE